MNGISSRNVIIIGAGIIGLGVARKLLQQGHRVRLIDPALVSDVPTMQASYAAAGMLAPSFEEVEQEAAADLREAGSHFAYGSLRLWSDYAKALIDDSGIDIDYRDCGTIGLAQYTTDSAWLEAMMASACGAGFPVEPLTAADLNRKLTGRNQPEQSEFYQGVLFPAEGQVDSRLLRHALHVDVMQLGASFEAMKAIGIDSSVSGAVVRVVTADGRHLSADQVVVAAGAQAASLWLEDRPLPLFSVKGQALSLVYPDTGTDSDRINLAHVIRTRSTYICPKAGGRLLIGASQELHQSTLHTDDHTINALRVEAVDIMPPLADWQIQETWAGLRPTLPDHLPLLDRSVRAPGVFYALAHYRNGVLFLPATVDLICALMQDDEAQTPMGAAGRF